jgi:prefoldin subunit 5
MSKAADKVKAQLDKLTESIDKFEQNSDKAKQEYKDKSDANQHRPSNR